MGWLRLINLFGRETNEKCLFRKPAKLPNVWNSKKNPIICQSFLLRDEDDGRRAKEYGGKKKGNWAIGKRKGKRLPTCDLRLFVF
jgi:hypothetical protein